MSSAAPQPVELAHASRLLNHGPTVLVSAAHELPIMIAAVWFSDFGPFCRVVSRTTRLPPFEMSSAYNRGAASRVISGLSGTMPTRS